MVYFSKGKRGKIFLKDNVAKKVGNSKHINNEIKWLKILNKFNIGPKLISSGKNYFEYHFIKGEFILDYIGKNDKNKVKKVIIKVLKQCRILDKLKVNKLEMHHPVKHIIVNSDVFMIDFERCYSTDKPKNISQFCQFLMSGNLKNLFKDKKIKINQKEFIDLVKNYKQKYNEKSFNEIIKFIKKA